MTKPKPPTGGKPPARSARPAGANPRLTAQIRKVLGKHYANRHGRVRG